MVSPTPIIKIDSIDDLFNSRMRFVARHDSALYTYLKSIDSPIIDLIDTFKDYSLIKDKLFNGLLNG